MADDRWEDIDVQAMLDRRAQQEATMAGNAGPYERPLGPLMRAPDVTGGQTPWDVLPPEYRFFLGRGPNTK